MYAEKFKSRHLAATDIGDDYDLLREGIIDSLGILEMITQLEEQFGGPIELADLDPENLMKIGPLSKYIEQELGRRE
jgi:acyl carrier protein